MQRKTNTHTHAHEDGRHSSQAGRLVEGEAGCEGGGRYGWTTAYWLQTAMWQNQKFQTHTKDNHDDDDDDEDEEDEDEEEEEDQQDEQQQKQQQKKTAEQDEGDSDMSWRAYVKRTVCVWEGDWRARQAGER